MGHKCHWTEGFYFLLALAGGAIFAVDFFKLGRIPDKVAPVLLITAAAISCYLAHKLVAAKRLAATLALMDADLQRIQMENERTQAYQNEKKAQNAEMEAKLAEMEKAQTLLKGATNGLEDIKAQNQALVDKRGKLLEQRRQKAEDMLEDMENLDEAGFHSAKLQLKDRMMMYFLELADPLTREIEVGSEGWHMLQQKLEHNYMTLPENAAEIAGDDGTMDRREFMEFAHQFLDYHFERLKTARDRIIALDCLLANDGEL